MTPLGGATTYLLKSMGLLAVFAEFARVVGAKHMVTSYDPCCFS